MAKKKRRAKRGSSGSARQRRAGRRRSGTSKARARAQKYLQNGKDVRVLGTDFLCAGALVKTGKGGKQVKRAFCANADKIKQKWA